MIVSGKFHWVMMLMAVVYLVGLTGCVSGQPGAYWCVTTLRGDPQPCVVIEDGKQKHLYSATATAYAMFLFWATDGGSTGEHFFEEPVKWWQCWKGYAMLNMPPQRSASDIHTVAKGLSPWIKSGDGWQSPQPARWVIATSPIVVAVGSDQVAFGEHAKSPAWEPHFKLGTFYAMVSEEDLDRCATELIVLDHWPTDMKDTGTEWSREFEKNLSRLSRRINLEKPTTLREIMVNRPWE